MKVKFVSEEEAARTDNADPVPVDRVKCEQRKFMAWAERSRRLRGAKEIRFIATVER